MSASFDELGVDAGNFFEAATTVTVDASNNDQALTPGLYSISPDVNTFFVCYINGAPTVNNPLWANERLTLKVQRNCLIRVTRNGADDGTLYISRITT